MRSTALGKLEQIAALELPLCHLLNRVQNRFLLVVFRTISRLGDWLLWILLAAVLLAVDGAAALPAVKDLLILEVICLSLYKLHGMARERPFVKHPTIEMLAVPLDRYSFPSGHTLHAVAFTLMFHQHYPALTWFLAPFAVLLALSRVFLGVHYPSDVLAGALLGALSFFF